MKDPDFSGVACYNIINSVASISNSSISNHLILESDLEEGYYSRNNFPENKLKHSRKFYLPVKNPAFCFQDIILRNASLINKNLGSNFEIAPGQMTILNKNHACIRVGTTETDKLPLLIEELKKIDFNFSSKREIKQYQSLIYFKKYTEFVKIGTGIYQDRDDKNQHFFEVPRLINFDEFLKGMVRIKNNCNYHLFDSFLTSIFLKDYTQDFIGIYSEHCDTGRFNELEDEIKKIFHV